MARRRPVDDPDTPDVDESIVTDGTIYDDDGDEVTPDTHICIEGTYVKHDHKNDPNPYRTVYGGQNVEHDATDAKGIWHYRHM